MKQKSNFLPAAVFAGALLIGPSLPVTAQQQVPRPIPQSEAFEHEEVVAKLTRLSERPPPVGPEAKKALDLIKPHLEHDRAIALPPLTLLPLLAEGKVTPDMKWALPLIDQVRAEAEQNTKDHEAITGQLNRLFSAANDANDEEAATIARECAGDLLGDDEVGEPTTLLIGEYLRAKLGDKQ